MADTSQIEEILQQWGVDSETAKNRLIEQTIAQFYGYATILLRGERIARFIESKDLAHDAVVHLRIALDSVRPTSAEHFRNLCAKKLVEALKNLVARRHSNRFEGRYQSDPDTVDGSEKIAAWECLEGRELSPATMLIRDEEARQVVSAITTALSGKRLKILEELFRNGGNFSETARAMLVDESTIRKTYNTIVVQLTRAVRKGSINDAST